MDSLLNRLNTVLQTFKSSENLHVEKFFRGDESVRKILLAWPDLPLELHEPYAFGMAPEHKHNQWKYVWKFRKIDFRDLEKATGIEDRKLLQEKVNDLITHQMIYPDGSLSRAAQNLLAS